MKVGRISEEDYAEFERLGDEYNTLQVEVSALLRDPTRDLTMDEINRVGELTKAQNELHYRRMALIRYTTG
ncbi:hypothetical protein G6M87_09160 [Rhizobium rhizogenes]|uniref:hypothetical protein n=1 Tax=Rhizobium rhizogenes TaxID=359 RepID=UPI00157261AC|nr:hypothetical protein [Rhizobium rhizogenes]NTI22030.1 hypothetical protein [Rhizobium rhizogenes]QTG05636.1 hypothetical protein G6M87_09160 [Rhizobium rhizogenes]